MSLNVAKCERYLERVLVLIPPSHEKYDASHVSIVYFCVLGLSILGHPLDKNILEQYLAGLWVGNGYKASVSYASNPASAHLTSTYFCLVMRRVLNMPALPAEDAARVLNFVASCQLRDGQFKATSHNLSETSIRHTYSAHAIARLLGQEHPHWFEKSRDYLLSCQNYDGGFGDHPLDESHAGLTYCALASLAMEGSLDGVHPRIMNYLGKRQNEDGGYNGRPNKASDVCYSFWVVAATHILEPQTARKSAASAREYILGPAVDEMMGGFVKTAGENADPYHTCLALFTLSLLGYPDLKQLDPVLTCTVVA